MVMDIKEVAKWLREILETGCEPCIFCEHTDLKGMAEACERFTWRPIETAPRDGSPVWAFNGEQVRMKWLDDTGTRLWVYHDQLLDEVEPDPVQPTHWMPLPDAPQP